MTELPKTFDPAAIEPRWYAHWEQTNAFRPERPDAPPFTIVMPPPNVTGSLHTGHALDITLQDILVRHARLQGKDALWVAGTDHAGIATQMVVERQMALHQDQRTNYTREDFVQKVWDWKAESGGAITQQLRRLGASCDWANERFTMDAGFSKAVIKVFVDLYNEGLLYRDKRLVNWDPGLKTAISDLEVEQREVRGKFWHFRYPLEDGSGFIAIATTRPETILGDGAVAVHPDDPRYAHLVGKKCKLPIVDRLIPIIADDYVKMDFGSGAVKITAAHDWNDYDVAKRHPEANIPLINLMNADATMSDACPRDYRGLDRYDARTKVVAEFDAMGLLDKIEDHVHMVPYGDRSGVVIEPWLTDQWYVDAKTLAGPAIEAVRSGAIKVVPATWEKTWFQWLENIQPWCVSRQLWWGHRIPAWFASDGRIFVAEDEAGAQALAGKGVALTQDEDVLDTWFSSALWPFGTLGWPDADAKLAKHYPNDVLISGFDILFFWDARMAMQGLHFMHEVPWNTLYLHGLVRAPDGSKMSKSKGNTVDPLGLIDQYGADALRFTLAAMESQGRDIKMDEKRLEGYRNFATKLWNAARFLQGNGVSASTSVAAPKATLAVNRWIIGEVVETLAKLDQAIADLRYDAMADAIYHFAWGTFCDWYVELIKGEFPQKDRIPEPVEGLPLSGTLGDAQDAPSTNSGKRVEETRAVAGWAFDQILVMLHPFMPFVTEELWHAMGSRKTDLIHAKWLTAPGAHPNMTLNVGPAPIAQQASDLMRWVIDVVSAVRAARNDVGIAPGLRLKGFVTDDAPIVGAYIDEAASLIERVGRIAVSHPTTPVPLGASIRISVPLATIVIPLDGAIDLDAERARLSKSAEAAEKEAAALTARLVNPAFVERARPEAVEKARADHAEKTAEAARLRAALARLG